MNTETGRIEGHRLRRLENDEAAQKDATVGDLPPWYTVHGNQNRWVSVAASHGRFLLDRENHQAWRLSPHLWLLAASQNRLLLSQCYSRVCTDFLVDSNFKEVAQLDGLSAPVFFSPGGDQLLFANADTVFVVDLRTLKREVLFTSSAHANWGIPSALELELVRGGEEIVVSLRYPAPEGRDSWQRPREWYRFSWSGEELSRVAWLGAPSPASHAPDGRHLVWREKGLALGFYEASEAWPSVVVADAATGQPIFRVRSASLQRGGASDWLATGDGLLLRTAPGLYGQGEAMLLRIRPSPRADRLPALAGAIPNWPFLAGTIASPTGSDRFFVETYTKWHDLREEVVGLYDAHEDRWHTAVLLSGNRYGDYDYLYPSWPSWGTSDSELRLTFAGGKATGGGLYLFAQPKIEFPPFSDEFVFRVAGTGSCLHLRDIPDGGGAVLDCLPDGTRVVLSHSEEWAALDWSHHPSVDWWRGNRDCCDFGVYVRTEDGLEGWVAHRYLEHD